MQLSTLSVVKNPLTIIAIFAGIAEIAMGATAIWAAADVRQIFVWFVVLFPVLLVVLFFLTLNLNHRVLYAPSDFKSDESFLEALRLKAAAGYIGIAEEKIAETQGVLSDLSSRSELTLEKGEQQRLYLDLTRRLEELSSEIEKAKETVGEGTPRYAYLFNPIQTALRPYKDGLTAKELESIIGAPKYLIQVVLAEMERIGGVIRAQPKDGRPRYVWQSDIW